MLVANAVKDAHGVRKTGREPQLPLNVKRSPRRKKIEARTGVAHASASPKNTAGTSQSRPPTRIAGLCGRGVVEVAAGGDATGDAGHTLAVTKAGAVFALGAGQHGQLGAGLPRAAAPVPVAIPAAAAPPRARRGQAWAAKRKTKSKQ